MKKLSDETFQLEESDAKAEKSFATLVARLKRQAKEAGGKKKVLQRRSYNGPLVIKNKSGEDIHYDVYLSSNPKDSVLPAGGGRGRNEAAEKAAADLLAKLS